MAAPVSEARAMSRTGRRLVSVKYPVSSWIPAARTSPIRTAPIAISRGSRSPTWLATSSATPPSSRILPGRKMNAATTTSSAEIAAEAKKPRLIAVRALRSDSRGSVRKMPITAVTTPIAGTTRGNTRPWEPNAALPRISAATSMTAYDSNRSAAIPAQSPTLSPTLSAIVAALRGSSSGIDCSTFPTRSAPTSAAFVKIPPPTRMNMASRAPPKPKPSSTVGAFSL